MKKTVKQTYNVQVRVEVYTDLQVEADSYEEALALARKISVKDVVSFETPYVDGSIAVACISNNEEKSHSS
jgi:hypothetical protein